MPDLELLKPKIRRLALSLIEKCREQGLEAEISYTLRTHEEQDALYRRGREASGDIVTNARAGYAFHNYGVAFDARPLVDGKKPEGEVRVALAKKIGRIGMDLGLEWGGTWESFPDLPHFQYTAGYSIGDFLASTVDWQKFE